MNKQVPGVKKRAGQKRFSGAGHLFYLAALLVFGIIAYHNSFQGAFLLDDQIRVLNYEPIRSLEWPWAFVKDVRRPFFYLTLALNYAVGEESPFGYHVFNLMVHLLAGISLFGLVHQTGLISKNENIKAHAPFLAFMAAALWLVHPIHTQAVTYITQRAESMMGMLFLGCLWSGARYLRTEDPRYAIAAAVLCLLGGLTKEVMVVCPAVMLLYDRAFVSSSFGEAIKKHQALYAGLAVTWAVMFYLLFRVTTVEAVPSSGLALKNLTPWTYLLTQCEIIPHYLKLLIWPHPLVFDYGWLPVQGLSDVWPFMTIMVLLAAASLWAYVRYPLFGFLGLSFFLILLPSSSVIPLKDLAFEHRMYLPSAFVISAAVLASWFMLERLFKGQAAGRRVIVSVSLAVTAAFMGLTIERNTDYHDPVAMWEDTLAKRPQNPRALNNVGVYYFQEGRTEDALPLFRKSLSLNPDPRAHTDFAQYLADTGNPDEAMSYFQQAIALDDHYADAYVDAGALLARQGHFEQAIPYYQKAIDLEPGLAVVYNNLGGALADLGDFEQAIGYYQKSIDLGFQEAGVYHNLGVAYAMTGKPHDAMAALEDALKRNPGLSIARQQLNEIRAKLKQDAARPK